MVSAPHPNAARQHRSGRSERGVPLGAPTPHPHVSRSAHSAGGVGAKPTAPAGLCPRAHRRERGTKPRPLLVGPLQQLRPARPPSPHPPRLIAGKSSRIQGAFPFQNVRWSRARRCRNPFGSFLPRTARCISGTRGVWGARGPRGCCQPFWERNGKTPPCCATKTPAGLWGRSRPTPARPPLLGRTLSSRSPNGTAPNSAPSARTAQCRPCGAPSAPPAPAAPILPKMPAVPRGCGCTPWPRGARRGNPSSAFADISGCFFPFPPPHFCRSSLFAAGGAAQRWPRAQPCAVPPHCSTWGGNKTEPRGEQQQFHSLYLPQARSRPGGTRGSGGTAPNAARCRHGAAPAPLRSAPLRSGREGPLRNRAAFGALSLLLFPRSRRGSRPSEALLRALP